MRQACSTTAMILAFSLLLAAAPAWAGEATLAPSETTGPIGAKTPGCKWGTLAKDEVNGEHLWFGGVGGTSPSGALLTWSFKNGAWTRAEFKDPAGRTEARMLAGEARGLYAAIANRYYVSENEKARVVKLDELCKGLAAKVEKLAVNETQSKKYADEAKAGLSALTAKLGVPPSAKEVAAARAAWMSLVKLEWTLSPEPAPRNYSAMVFDAESK